MMLSPAFSAIWYSWLSVMPTVSPPLFFEGEHFRMTGSVDNDFCISEISILLCLDMLFAL